MAKCGVNGIDTHPNIIATACGIFYMPSESGNVCKYYAKCQRWIKKVINKDEEPRCLHEKYLQGEEE